MLRPKHISHWLGRIGMAVCCAFPSAAQSIGPSIPLGGWQMDVAVSPSTHRVFVAQLGQIRVIDGYSMSVIATLPLSNRGGLGINTATDKIYVCAYPGGTLGKVGVFDGATLAYHELPPVLTYGIAEIAVHRGTNRIYVTDNTSNRLYVIDGNTEALLATIPVGYQPYGVAVNETTNRIYVGQTAAYGSVVSGQGIAVIDGNTNTLTGYIPVNHPVGKVVLDTASGKLYATSNGNNPVLEVVDMASGTVTKSMPNFFDARGMGWNRSANRLYVGRVSAGGVNVIDTLTDTVIGSLPVGVYPGGGDLDIDAAFGRVYVPDSLAPGLQTINEAASTTATGSAIQVAPVDPVTGTTPVSITFDSVTSSGSTTVTSGPTGPPPPTGFKLGSPPTYYYLDTTASFSGTATVCISYAGIQFANESTLKLLHLENNVWVDRTTSINTATDTICAAVTSFSPFTVVETAFAFSGFQSPVENPPVWNGVRAGAAVPVRFSLGRDYGLNIFAPGFPAEQAVACDGGAAVTNIDQTVTAGSSGLSYAAGGSGTYTYTWKTEKAWSGTCRVLILRFTDGTLRTARFRFAD